MVLSDFVLCGLNSLVKECLEMPGTQLIIDCMTPILPELRIASMALHYKN